MTLGRREVYIVSDIHLGGAYPASADPEDRGFRICTHARDLAQFIEVLSYKPQPVEVVVNGDLVDFLAEQSADGTWIPFRSDQVAAAGTLETIVNRDSEVFRAFGRLLAKGHRLVVLLGNHDIELALPRVRRAFEATLGITGAHDFAFIYDGEAYSVGGALIEHGNRYDQFNVVDNDGLRRLRSLLSRRSAVPRGLTFEAPAGSHMVASVINPIKAEYSFVDLLKPETAAVIPLLLTLEPGFRRVLSKVAALAISSRTHRLRTASMPSFAGDISAVSGIGPHGYGEDLGGPLSVSSDPLDAVVHEVLQSHAGVGLESGGESLAGMGGDVSTYQTIERGQGLARLLISSRANSLSARLPALLASLRALQNDKSFRRDVECYPEYLNAAQDLATHGRFDCVIFGHTHLARDIPLAGGARYLNTGTWADVITFPSEVITGPEPQALDALRTFVEDLGSGRLKAWTSFAPTYARLELEDDQLLSAAVHDYVRTAAL